FLDFLRLVIAESERFPELAKTFLAQLERTGVGRVTALLEAIPGAAEAELRARLFMCARGHLILMQELPHGRAVAPAARAGWTLVEQRTLPGDELLLRWRRPRAQGVTS
ncbi:TetR/AcrR family transcriptional regulator C-terminal domain-containing protein, partial [Synechococcus sp. BA-120 BA3]|nr:TetR/AcrR family transcriptional regulator C-terminal domain-containing protein [Synechococcus sp. BA-120 BA3]